MVVTSQNPRRKDKDSHDAKDINSYTDPLLLPTHNTISGEVYFDLLHGYNLH